MDRHHRVSHRQHHYHHHRCHQPRPPQPQPQPQPTTTSCLHSRLPFFFCGDSVMDASGQPSGAAQRRRQRRMRSWWRHEKASIAAAVATVLHHSAQRGGGVVRRPTETEDSGTQEVQHATRCGPRAQKTPPPGPQRSDRSLRHFSGECLPTLGLRVLAGASPLSPS